MKGLFPFGGKGGFGKRVEFERVLDVPGGLGLGVARGALLGTTCCLSLRADSSLVGIVEQLGCWGPTTNAVCWGLSAETVVCRPGCWAILLFIHSVCSINCVGCCLCGGLGIWNHFGGLEPTRMDNSGTDFEHVERVGYLALAGWTC